MIGTITRDGTSEPATADDVERALSAGDFFWLDLDTAGATRAEASRLLADVFHFHPLAVEDADHFGQRPKFDDYDDFGYLVAYGASAQGQDCEEIHIFVTGSYAVTVHRGPSETLSAVHQRLGRHWLANLAARPVMLTYLVVDALTDSFFPVLAELDDRIDELEGAILARPTEEQLGQIFAMKRRLMSIRKVVSPQRDVLASLSAGVTKLPGMTEEGNRYFRDLYDHLIRLGDTIDAYRDLLSGVMDTHISTVSNRLNVVMKQLTIIATVFLPLSFITGFFGQNFAWLVAGLQSAWIFWVVGVGADVAAVAVLVVLFKRRGWLGGPSA